jgi:hypothetical protein
MRNEKGQYIKGSTSNFKGKTQSMEAREKMRKAKLGGRLTEEHKKKIGLASKGISHGPMSEETKSKISLAKKGCIGHNKGKKFTNEWLKNLSLSHNGDGRIGNRYQKHLMNNRRRRIRLNETEGSHSLEEWENLKIFYNFMCLCCKKNEPAITLTEDHIIPISIGGSDYINNIQPLCRNCNSKKNNKIISFLPLNHNDLIYVEKGLVN